MIKAVLFDLDGTIIDTNELIEMSFKHAFKVHLNEDRTSEEVTKFFGQPLRDSFISYGEDTADRMIKTYRDFNEAIHDEGCKEFEGVKETLEFLKAKGIKLAIVTSKRRVLAERGMNLFDLRKYFDAIVTPEDTAEHKPKPGPVLKACELLGVAPNEAMMVGDSHFDLMSGKTAGAKTCGVRYTALPIKWLEECEPDYFIDSIDGMKKIV